MFMKTTNPAVQTTMTIKYFWASSLPSRTVITIIAVLVYFASPGGCIDCYKCTSINGKVEACEDKFDTGIATVGLISRNCEYGYFKGTHCIKLKGQREDGTKMTVRDCSDEDWGSHCGDIRYVYGNQEQRIYGCLEACAQDGCNSAVRFAGPPFICTVIVPFLLTLARL